MFGSTLILTLALTCQLPGGDCPAVPDFANRPDKQWLTSTSAVDGQPIRIWGWIGPDGCVHFNPQDYPQFVPRPEQRVNQPAGGYPPTGVVFSKIPAVSAGEVWRGGNVQSKVGAAGDRDRPPDAYLTVIGTKEDRQRVRQKLEASPEFRQVRESMGEKLAVNYYPPTAVMVAKVGLPDGGKPDVVIQDARGGEVKRWHGDPEPEVAAQEVRQLDPSYRPGGHDPKPEGEGPWLKGGVVVLGFGLMMLACIALQNRGRQRWNTRS